jgi:hypothetical protein
MTYNDGNYLPDADHRVNVGPCIDPTCRWDVYAPDAQTQPVHFACDMALTHREAA